MKSKLKNIFFKNKKRTSLTALVALLIASMIGSFAYFSDHIEAQMYLTIAAWQGEPVIQQWEDGAATDFHAYKDTVTGVTFLDVYDQEADTFKNKTSEVWDVSHAKDESVMAYMVGNEVYICSNVGKQAQVIANPYSSYAFDEFTAMTSFNNASNLDFSHVITTEYMFSNCGSLTELDLNCWDTGKVTNFSWMFYMEGVLKTNMTTLKVNDWDTSNAEQMNGTFSCLSSIQTLDVSEWNTDKLKSANYMFSDNPNLKTLDLTTKSVGEGTDKYTAWNTSNLESTVGMFQFNSKMTSIDISSWDMSDNKDNSYMFYSCEALESLTIPGTLDEFNSYFAADCTALDEITFLHDADAKVTFPTAGASEGAFYVPGYLSTTINTENDEIMYGYLWHDDNRRPIPKLDAMYSWFAPVKDTNVTRFDISTVNMVDYYKPTGNEFDVWDGSAAKDGSVMVYLDVDSANQGMYKVTIAGNGYNKIFANEDSYGAFWNFIDATRIDGLSLLDTSKTTNMEYMFNGNGKVEELDVGHFNTSKVTSMRSMFSGCSSITDYDIATKVVNQGKDNEYIAWNTGKVENMSTMFELNNDLKSLDISNWDTRMVQQTYHMFFENLGLKTLDLSTEPVSLGNLSYDSWDTGKLQYAEGMFLKCRNIESIDVSTFDTSAIQNSRRMFGYCEKLTTVDVSDREITLNGRPVTTWDTSSNTDLYGMFQYSGIKSIDVSSWDTSLVEDFQNMFYECKSLESLDVSSFDTSSATNYRLSSFAWGCTSLTTITLGENFGGDGQLSGAGVIGGLFYVPEFLETTINGANDTMTIYCWYDDNRAHEPMLASGSSWYQGTTDKTTITEINLVDRYIPTGNETESWDASDPSVPGTVTAYVEGTKLTIAGNGAGFIYANPNSEYAFGGTYNGPQFSAITAINGLSNLDTSKVTNMKDMFSYCKSLTSLDVSGFDTNQVSDMQFMFYRCNNLTSLDVSGFKTSLVDSMRAMFSDCSSLTTLDVSGFDTSAVTDMYSTFNDCSRLTSLDVSGFNTNLVDTMYSMFSGCSSLTSLDVSGFNTGKVENMAMMFNGCSSLTSLDVSKFTTNDVTDMSQMFAGCRSLTTLDLSNFVTNKVRLMSSMFSGCSSLTTLDVSEFNTSAVTSMFQMFSNCRSLTSLDVSGFNTSAVTSMFRMFASCNSLTSLDLSSFNTSAITSPDKLYNFALYCNNLTNIKLGENFGQAGMIPAAGVIDESKEYHGMFYVGNYLETTITGANDVMKIGAYDWEADNRYKPLPMLAEKATWYKGTTAKNTITEINLVDRYIPTGNETESWDASDPSVPGTVTAYVEGTKLTIAGNGAGFIYANPDSSYAFSGSSAAAEFSSVTALNGLTMLDTSKVTNMTGMFSNLKEVTTLDVSAFDTSKATTMRSMFYGCKKLTTLDVSGFDTSNVTDMMTMFGSCNSITSLDVGHFNTSNVTTLQSMFVSCYNLTSLDIGTKVVSWNGKTYTAWDTSNVKNMISTFNACRSLQTLDVGNWNTSQATNTSTMFGSCSKLENLDVATKTTTVGDKTYTAWNTGNVTDMSSMFQNNNSLTSIAVDDWDVSNVTDLHLTFGGCPKLTSLNVSDWDVRKVTNMGGTFNSCDSLTTLDVSKWKTESLDTVTFTGYSYNNGVKYYTESGIFGNCQSLKAIDISGWDMSKVTNNPHMFYNCDSLESLTIPASVKVISPEFAYGCEALTTITFKHSSTDDLTIQATAGATSTNYHTEENPNVPGVYADGGAFYVGSYLKTTINAEHDAAKNYDWATDNRAKLDPMLAKQSTWYKGTTAKNTITEINIVDKYTPTGNETESWDASDPSVPGTVTAYVEGTKLTIAGSGAGLIYANPDSSYAFSGSSAAAQFRSVTAFNGLTMLDTSKVTNMRSMFYYCKKLTSLDVSKFDTSKVTNMRSMFSDCEKLTSLDVSKFDTSKVTDMRSMFSYCEKLTSLDLSNFNTSSVTEMSYMFFCCSSLTNLNLSSFNTAQVMNMDSMFNSCSGLTSLNLSNFNTARVTDMSAMFEACSNLSSLNVSSFNTANVTDMSCMFSFCELLSSLDVSKFDTGKVTDMYQMFCFCSSLTSLDLSNFDTNALDEVRDLIYFASDCYKLTNIKLGENFGQAGMLPSAGADQGMFYSIKRLKNITVTGANSVMKAYDWAADNRTVTFKTTATASTLSVDFDESTGTITGADVTQ